MAAQNPHIPKYIKDAPWYADKPEDNDDYLSHHRSGAEQKKNNEPKIGSGIKDEFILDVDTVRKRKRKGKCTNCGSDDHEKRDCLETPGVRKEKRGKRNEDVDYDGKRDRWFGYDSKDYSEYVKKWEEKKKKEDEAKGDEREWDTDEEIELKELGLWDVTIKQDMKKAEGEKLVRLREDRAAYLEDIRNDTVKYDPKSRTVRDDSTGYFNEDDRFVRHLTGEAQEFEKTKVFAWDEEKRGVNNDNFVSNPTLAGRKIKERSQEEKAKREKLRKSLLDRYGGEEDEDDALASDKDDVVRSSYVEDVYPGNHTSVWGSYYKDGKWGYRCCKSMERNSVCK